MIRDSGLPYTFLRNNLYTDHYAPQIRQAVTSGVFVGSADVGRVASATRADYAAAAVAVLIGDGHENKDISALLSAVRPRPWPRR